MENRFFTVLDVDKSRRDLGKNVYSNKQSNPAVSPATIATLSSGQFVGIVANEPVKKMPLKAFHTKVVKEVYEGSPQELPEREVDQQELQEQFKRVKREVVKLVQKEMSRIRGIQRWEDYSLR